MVEQDPATVPLPGKGDYRHLDSGTRGEMSSPKSCKESGVQHRLGESEGLRSDFIRLRVTAMALEATPTRSSTRSITPAQAFEPVAVVCNAWCVLR